MEKHENDDKHKAPLDQYEGVELPAIAVAPDGGIVGVGSPISVPAATPENFVCLRGPCRHYWQVETFIAAGNPSGTFGPKGLIDPETKKPLRIPRQINRSCLAHPGTETELTEDCAFACNKWDPLTPREVRTKEKAAEKYYRIHPNHRPKEA